VFFVVPPKVLLHAENQALAVSMSQKVILDCPIDGGDPPPQITWFRMEQPVELSERVYQLENGSLVIYDSGVCTF
jgi:CD80-like C2-set immunoglobulin domain